MTDPALPLKQLKREHGFLVGIDSDGCVFDTMEVKHKECFIPNFINTFDLQAAAKFARETAEFVNLYSIYRGLNRFPALIKTLDLLAERDEVVRRNVAFPDLTSLREWVKQENRLGNPALKAAVQETKDPILARALSWSTASNEDIQRIVRNVPPFPYVRKCLERMVDEVDMIVVSATPCEALTREWEEHEIAQYMKVMAGQEMGTKKEHLAHALGNRYESDNVLMIGDAPGDLKAARDNGVSFFPIIPGDEEASWKRFYDQAYDRFISGDYGGDYEAKLVAEFEKKLPSTPPWKRK